MERVHAAGEEIVRVSVAAGGVLSGEHGIGLEKRDLMPLQFSPVDLDLQARLREAFDPDGRGEPGQGPARRQPVRGPPAGSGGRVDLTGVRGRGGRPADPVTCVRTPPTRGTSGGRSFPARGRSRPRRVSSGSRPEEMTVACGAGTPVAELEAALAERGQRVALPPWGTVGGVLAVGRSGVAPAGRRAGAGHAAAGRRRHRRWPGGQGRRADREERERLRPGAAAGGLARHPGLHRRRHPAHPAASGGGGVVRGLAGCRPVRAVPCALPADEPALGRDDEWVLLEGHPADIAAQAGTHGLHEVEGPAATAAAPYVGAARGPRAT